MRPELKKELNPFIEKYVNSVMDHMDGIDFQTKAGKMALDIAKRKRAKAIKKMKKMQEK